MYILEGEYEISAATKRFAQLTRFGSRSTHNRAASKREDHEVIHDLTLAYRT